MISSPLIAACKVIRDGNAAVSSNLVAGQMSCDKPIPNRCPAVVAGSTVEMFSGCFLSSENLVTCRAAIGSDQLAR
jgi:hypothetical protein